MSVVYGLYDPTIVGPPHIRYVGYTGKLPADRLIEHIAESNYKRRSHRHKWIRSVLVRGVRPALLILEEVGEDWMERERFWIARMRCMRLVNGTDGGEGLINPSATVRAAISAKVSVILRGNQYRKGIPHTDEARAKMSEGHAHSEKTKAYNASKKGKLVPHLLTEEARRKSAESKCGKPRPWASEWAKELARRNIGRCWINNGVEAKRLPKGSEIPDGWMKGQLPQSEEVKRRRAETLRITHSTMTKVQQRKFAQTRSTYGKVWITNEIVDRPHEKNEPIPEGWRKGRRFVRRKSRREALQALQQNSSGS